MREIKFRAWLKDQKEMVDVNTICFIKSLYCKDGYIDYPNPAITPDTPRDKWPAVKGIEMEHIILMQYTGLKDKNGKEIYEGDILEEEAIGTVIEVMGFFPLSRHRADYGRRLGFYMHNDKRYKIMKKYHKLPKPDYDSTWGDWVSNPEYYIIIGNIHENHELLPDLLEGK